jgi:hypothetical protein
MTGTGFRMIREGAILGAFLVVGFTVDVSPTTWLSKGTIMSQAQAAAAAPAKPHRAAITHPRRHARRPR